MHRILFGLSMLTSIASLRADSSDGYANVGFTVTGGAGGETVVVTNGAQLNEYADSNKPYIIHVSGTLQIVGMDTHVRANKTIIGLGTNATLEGGGLYLYKSTNVIIRNLTIKGSTDDDLGMLFSQNVWVDHCTFMNAKDGLMDIGRASDNVTISWCKFIYAPKVAGSTHEYVHLIGSSDSDTALGGVPFKVTLHHNWYGDNAIERMPSVRNGRVHVFNCYYTCVGNNYCVRTRLNSQVLVENNNFIGVQNPWELLTTSGTTGLLKATGNITNSCTWVAGWYPGQSLIPGTDSLSDFTPVPYSYTNVMHNASDVPFYIQTYSGNGKYPFAP